MVESQYSVPIDLHPGVPLYVYAPMGSGPLADHDQLDCSPAW